MPTVMFMLLAVFSVVSIGVVASIQAQSGAVRDQQTKSALASAEAGVSQALLHYNGDFTPPASQPCLLPSGSFVGAASVQSGGWCAAVAGSDGAGTFTYQVKPTAGTIEVVSSGNFSGVTRRIDVTAKSVSGQQIFVDAGVKTQNGINLDANSEIHSGVRDRRGHHAGEQLEAVRSGERGHRAPSDHRRECRLLPANGVHHPAEPVVGAPAGHHPASCQPGRRGDPQRQRSNYQCGGQQWSDPKGPDQRQVERRQLEFHDPAARDRPQQLPDADRTDLQLLRADLELELRASTSRQVRP